MEEIPVSSSPNDIVSSQKSLPSTHDHGWNDPPEWALSSQHNSSGTSTKKLLNKRVAFPLSSHTSSSEKAAVLPASLNMPPMLQSTIAPTITTAPHKPLLAPTDKDCAKTESDDNFDKDQALTEILTSLESVMTEQKMEENKVKEIRKRLDIMKSNWLENKLNDKVQRNILNISKALLRKDIKEADKIQVILMTQHAPVCHTWMPAIRHIIFELKKESEKFNDLQPEQLPLLFVNSKKN
ncbi:PREDICTED: steroid receptor RNA activator 1-like [Cyphomyrmex costatus]|uniref:Steroid receptor RNA activator 1 n=1 Tax=Cyphomyrmex costatus TaxID=456900 RepID=A0A195CAQ6_9HYME|nr:PREDICTED: steroid receptor RNA activator 1-like [Cyphomyrmex costatus]KYM97897.1 Steroid receptor RNA activator 1 [Cyphomyrmex costatus]